ncbi:ABC transporter substrate-binding protein [Sulfuritalea sp.]|uniref:ABC transporter substrate-binding protein n=1 Tax=Sulfuritalea sp. TaxID=2480090 RepID=UPI00286E23DD|nr:ABC transporter substrate-binding protein [Sulfuritalea sp.]
MSKKKIVGVLLIVIVAALALFLRGRSVGNDPVAQTIVRDIISLDKGQISSFDPLDAFHANHIQLVKQLFSTLTELDPQGNIVPGLAKSWQSQDGRTWSFRLREKVRFVADPCFQTDQEREVTAEHVKYSLRRLLTPATKSIGASYFSHIVGARAFIEGKATDIDGIKVIDNQTIEFHLEQPDFGFPKTLSVAFASIVHPRVIACKGDKAKMSPVGTGPFVLEKYDPTAGITLARNGEYWESDGAKSLPWASKIEISVVADQSAAVRALIAGQTNFLDLTPAAEAQISSEIQSGKFIVDRKEWTQFNFLLVNLERIPNSAQRRYLANLMNYENIQGSVGKFGRASAGIYPYAIFPRLAEAELRDLANSPKPYAQPDIKLPHPLRMVTFDDFLSRSVAQRIAEDLRKQNIELEIESVAFPILVERLLAGKYDLIQLYWGPLFSEETHFLTPFLSRSFPPGGNNFNRYANPEVDRLAAGLRTMQPDDAQQALLHISRLMHEDVPLLPLYYSIAARASDGRFELPLHPLGYKFYKLVRPRPAKPS